MEITEAIIHRLIKDPNQSKHAEVDPRNDRLAVNDVLIKLTQEVIKIYNRVSNGHGTFDPDHDVYRFPSLAKDYVDEELDFVPFSKSTASLIADKMKTEPFASGGYLLMVRYKHGDFDGLIIAMLKLKPGTAINEKTKELLENLALDVDHLHEAARVSIPKWYSGEEPYLSFVKKRAGKDDITRYFRTALGCTNYTSAKHHTEQAIQAIKDYMDSQDWDTKTKNKVKSKVHEYLSEKSKNKEPVNLTHLSGVVHDSEPENFKEFVKDNEYPINEVFDPDPKTFKKFKRIQGKVGTINISFDVDDVVDGRVKFDPATGKIIISTVKDSQIAKDISEHQNDNPD